METNELTLEKLKVKERLEAIEAHMKSGDENRTTLMKGFEDLRGVVMDMQSTLFGVKGSVGLVQRMDAVLKIADGIKWVLTKIFMALCTAIVLAMAPGVFKYLSSVLIKHTGV